MTEITPSVPGHRAFLETSRRDFWWIGPLASGLGFLVFVVYTTWVSLMGTHYQWGPYLSPFFSPLIQPKWWGFSPAILILWAPLGFRMTCYYYRKFYYRAFFLTPAGCAVGARPQTYRGERALFVFQNLHRFFLYLALIFVVILTYDAILAFNWNGKFGMGVGTIVMVLNALFIAFFTFGCNSLRHLVGGNVDCYSCAKFGAQRHGLWRIVTRFNEHHQFWAWVSMIWVGLTDLYIRLLSMGVIADLRIL